MLCQIKQHCEYFSTAAFHNVRVTDSAGISILIRFQFAVYFIKPFLLVFTSFYKEPLRKRGALEIVNFMEAVTPRKSYEDNPFISTIEHITKKQNFK